MDGALCKDHTTLSVSEIIINIYKEHKQLNNKIKQASQKTFVKGKSYEHTFPHKRPRESSLALEKCSISGKYNKTHHQISPHTGKNDLHQRCRLYFREDVETEKF